LPYLLTQVIIPTTNNNKMSGAMGLAKQAKVLSKRQIALTAALVAQTRYPTRNHAIFLLSVKAGLRAKEIASLTWDMVTDAEGNLGTALHLRDEASKGASGRVIPLNKELRVALQKLHDQRSTSPYVITTERSQRTSASAIVNLFASWYRAAGLQGCSSHSGRRTFITNAARTISTVGGSLRDVQMLAGHSALSTTQRYIEADAEAQKRVVDLV
jgi:integrase/recombinase XerD